MCFIYQNNNIPKCYRSNPNIDVNIYLEYLNKPSFYELLTKTRFLTRLNLFRNDILTKQFNKLLNKLVNYAIKLRFIRLKSDKGCQCQPFRNNLKNDLKCYPCLKI